MPHTPHHISVQYWPSGSVFIATSVDVPGLVLEEASLADLQTVAPALIPVLLERAATALTYTYQLVPAPLEAS